MKAAILSSFSKRFRGLLPGSPARDSSFAVFVPCRDIHTFGMDAPIDVAFADHMGRVLVSRRAVGPRERVRCVSAKVAIERLASTERCLHDFSREDTSPIGQVVSSSCDQEIEEAVMPSGDRRSVVPRFAELPTQVSGRARQSGGSVARIEQARSPQRQTHIVVPLEGSGEPPVISQGFRLVISLEAAPQA